MSTPLVSPDLARALGDGPILAVERREAVLRDTAAHRHAPGQLIGGETGLLSVETPAGRWVVPATHAIWVPPHHCHALRSHGPFAGWSIYVVEPACAALPVEPRTLRMSDLLRAAVRRAACWGGAPSTPAEHRLADVVLDEIAALPAEPLGLPLPRDARLLRVAHALLDDLSDGRGVAEWAGRAALSERTLARRFRAETGFSLAEWRQRARVLRAIELLAEGVPVTRIAIDLGYDNLSAFIAMFRRGTGTTPGRYGRAGDAADAAGQAHARV